jgi:hypothetical protein
MVSERDAEIQRRLRQLHRQGLEHALDLLRPWFVPLVWLRPRYAAEPTGAERKRLWASLKISEGCELARRERADYDEVRQERKRRAGWLDDQLAHSPGGAVNQFWLRLNSVWNSFRSRRRISRIKRRLDRRERFIRRRADRPGAEWQVSYNAACFFALRNKRGPAFEYLRRAVASEGRKPLEHWIDQDPDLAHLRAEDPKAWDQLMKVVRGKARAAHPDPPNRYRWIAWIPGLVLGLTAAAIALAELSVPLRWVVYALPAALVLVSLYCLAIVSAYRRRARRLADLQRPQRPPALLEE